MIEQTPEDPTGVLADLNSGESAGQARMRKSAAAIQMKLAGATWAEIALALGYATPRSALVATEKALSKEWKEGDRAELRQMASLRLDRLLRSVWPKAVDPANPEHLLAVTKAREVIASFTKLHGLDAPSEVIVHSPTADAIEQWVARAVSLGLPEVDEDDVIDADFDEDFYGEDDDDAVAADG